MLPSGHVPAVSAAGGRLRLVATSCRSDRLEARLPGCAGTLLVRPAEGAALPVEGESFDLEVSGSWRGGALRWLTGRLSGVRLDLAALGVEPLALVELAPWRRGPDRCGTPAAAEYELERVPVTGPGEPEATLHRAIELWAGDRRHAAEALLAGLLRRDLRCLAAHSCLGLFAFNAAPDLGGAARARRHYEVGLAIAGLSLPPELDALLPWSRLGNRAYLRCLYGRSICLWRQGDLDEARAGLLRLCRLNPGDQLAARVALDAIDHAGR